jgi:outer membrane protein
VNKTPIALCAFALAFTGLASAQAPTKVGVINMQAALVQTKDGQKAVSELEAKATPKRKALEGKQNEINALKDQLAKGANTLSESAKAQLFRDIDLKTKSLNRDVEDAEAESQVEQQRVLQEIGPKISAVIDKYGKDNGFALILDVSSQQTPVVYISSSIDITREVIDLYDKNSGSMTPTLPKPVAPAPKPVTPTPKPAGTK